MTASHKKIICALDTVDVNEAARLGNSLTPHVGALKLGLEFFTAHGAAGVREIAKGGLPVFLDLKFHDIPNTVAGAVRAALPLKPFMLTLHASGGEAMLKAAVEAANATESGSRPLLLAVTVLTSMDGADLQAVGVPQQPEAQVLRLAELAQRAGVDGIVCSPHEIRPVREKLGNALKLVVPGIRPAGSATGDQKRMMTPAEALKAGADYLVIGRPITQAADPQVSAAEIAASL